ncbi:MAG: 5-bromo-4-chloroindolyl phosphate hydrolysis family protein [Clostridium sp.]|jgi:hypothetical protein|nr:5-bromo-4-chloroindolyl phosphate hydrolysis family protein [Clostridium sp.]
MNDSTNQDRVSERIKGALQEGLKTGDFHDLNEVVVGSAKAVLDEVLPTFREAMKGRVTYHQPTDYIRQPKHQQPASPPIPKAKPIPKPKYAIQKVTYQPPFPYKKVGEVSGVLIAVFSGMSAFTVLFSVLPRYFFLTSPHGSVFITGILIFTILAFLFCMMQGIAITKRYNLAQRYVSYIGSRTYIDIAELAQRDGTTRRRTLKNVYGMLKGGVFPQGRLDHQHSCLMLTDSIYQTYMEVSNQRRLEQESAQVWTAPEEESASTREKNQLLRQGEEYIKRLRRANDSIPGEVISTKLTRLEQILTEIFDRIRDHENPLDKMQKFMEYYLPTTFKLIQAYEDFDKVSAPGVDIQKAKDQIENTLDTINEAFAQLRNGLYQEAVFDATTDAMVLRSMLTREGLTEPFHKVPQKEDNT